MAAMSMARPVAKRVRPSARGTIKAARMMMAGSRRVGEMQGRAKAQRKARRGSGRRRLTAFAAGTGAGMAAEYLLDPEQGKRRRHAMRDRALAMMRKGSREAERKSRYMAGKAQGVAAEATPPGRDSSELNDPALEAKVQTELFRSPDVSKESVNVNVEEGVVYLRGEVESSEQREALIGQTREIDGVTQVESLLHLPGEAAPRKA